jgi:hypothetical protein
MAISNTKYWLASLVLALSSISGAQAWGESFFELSLGAGERQLDIFRKGAPADADDASFLGLSIAAYRNTSDRSAWGGVIEVLHPIGRENDIGNGKILGFRPVNYLRRWSTWLSSELFMGAAQYGWIENATGYYLGGNARFHFGDSERYAVGIDYKYFQDLAHDGGPGGDQIVDGPALSANFYYRFGQ